ncbi:IS3 family transposase [Dyadobacter flavalbus]|uniref:IS3 family transposase n=1 Tax=Dyadobacter flavalbus TaxID=2579942 RepID=A0A5M8QVU1_9BACT|nr:IS3 family transposase [Dyadobacter flavalbus]KAA6438756.1 IS3 family transposase [Dyadobacter flavalbus]
MTQYQQSTTRKELCKWLGLPRSVSYYKARNGKPGAKASQVTMKLNGSLVPNEDVVIHIRKLIDTEFNAASAGRFGYEYATHELKKEYLINKKKVYRLMLANSLLLNKMIRPSGNREFVQFRRIEANKPLEYLCWDIKYVWVHGERRNYYLLCILDVCTRKIIDWIFQSSIRQLDLINLLRRVNHSYQLQGVILRNDNGSQFISHKVRNFLKNSEVKQEFTHVATPEENSYIEAFHSILESEVIERSEFASYYETKETIQRFITHYNQSRLHRSIGFITPQQKWEKAMVCDKTIHEEVSN